ncbi:unnamed protein product [Prorocentrum cordatum]|uniref:Cyclin N-terminal domain-containing protein n=1 Tax=Prorocentrum cordatum TaxID=2364126 RepID=A0ABN9TB92_9DINO|nr:unnamed protein product [Polarella glacialis]
MREIAATVDELDISTVATAWVYFEKLVLGDFVRKANRKLLAGASLILAFKFNQPSWGSRDKETSEAALLKKLADRIRKLDRKDQLDQAALRNAEVRVFVWLEFSLHLQRAEVLPHLHRMLKDNGETLEHYYGAETTRIVNDEWRLLSGLDDTDGGERGARKPWHKSPLQSPLLGAWLPPARVPERIHLEPHPPRDRLASG